MNGWEFNPRFTNKKRAVTDAGQAKALQDAGYSFPAHWRNPLSRDFIGWDGEGITGKGKVVQDYVLFGASTGDRIIKPSLGTIDCFNLLLAVESQYPNAIHCGFALQYDVNMILRDLSRRHLVKIYETHKCWWEGYRIEYRPGKWLNVRKDKTTVRLFDVFGFFQSSFVVACEKFLGPDDPELVQIREGKAARKSFSFDQLEVFIVPYWEAELRLLVRLMDSLRTDLTEAELPIASWHGPGAVANTVFRINHVKLAKGESPREVQRASQYAYAGGRFELFRCGHYPNTVWEYDINSAYPSAIAELPDLSQGNWRYVESFRPGSFGVWNVSYIAGDNPLSQWFRPQPLFVRDKHGNVSYPPLAEGWYWTPEASAVPSRCIKGGWVFDHDGSKPFAFVHEMYERRQQWKSEQNSAERALKLALNSLYGKMAQRTGWTPENQQIPVWHQLEWAGYVTSSVRKTIWDAIASLPQKIQHSLVATETDAIFSTVPLTSLKLGTRLGEWEATRFDWITYLQNGMYFGEQDGKMVEKYRGFDKGSVTHKGVMEYLHAVDSGNPSSLFGITTRFVGLGLGLHTKAVWRSWPTETRRVSLGGGGKRTHVGSLCPECKQDLPLVGNLHSLAVVTSGGRSHPHSLPWLDEGDSELRRLDELTRW